MGYLPKIILQGIYYSDDLYSNGQCIILNKSAFMSKGVKNFIELAPDREKNQWPDIFYKKLFKYKRKFCLLPGIVHKWRHTCRGSLFETPCNCFEEEGGYFDWKIQFENLFFERLALFGALLFITILFTEHKFINDTTTQMNFLPPPVLRKESV